MQTVQMYIWRVSNYADLSGRGGLIANGRWHTVGKSIVYCSDSCETAVKEVTNRVGSDFLLPDGLKILQIDVPASTEIIEIEQNSLPSNWRDDKKITRRIGDRWLRDISSPLLRVPSAICDGLNILINPSHRSADFLDISNIFGLDDLVNNRINK